MTRVFILSVYDECNFNRRVHVSAHLTDADARRRRDQIVQEFETSDRQNGWDCPSYRGDVEPIQIEEPSEPPSWNEYLKIA